MRVNLNIEEDDQFRKYVKELIGGQVRAILREQLSGIVAGEIAKVRLLQPDSPTLNEMITKQIKSHVDHHMWQASTQIRDELARSVKEAVKPYTETIKLTIKEGLVKAIRASV